MKTRHSVITGLGVTAGAVMGLAAPALGANITVSNVYDPGNGSCDLNPANLDCTLREAVALANTTAADDDIYFASNVTGTISLDGASYGPIGITNPVTIHGPGPGTLTIDAQGDSGIFYTDMVTPGDYVTIQGLHLANGSQLYGGAIDDINSTMTVTNSVLSGNEAFVGGAIYESGDYFMFTTFSTLNNNAANYGGAIGSPDSFGLLGAVTLAGNEAFYGGALNAFGGRIFDSTISGNQATYGSGGAFTYYGYSYNSILANNTGGNPDIGSPNWFPYFSLIESPGFSPISSASNIIGQDPQLGALASNGGSTLTLKPAAGSPVVDKGYSDVSFDQRLFPRTVDNPVVANAPGGNGTDMGSVELTLGEGPQPAAAPPPVVKKKKCKKKKKKHRSAEAAKKKKCKKKKKRSVSASAAASQARSAWEARVRSGPHHRFRDMKHPHSSGHADWANHAWKVGP